MNTSRLLYLLVVTTATIMKANAEADDHSILAKGLFGLRGTYLKPLRKKEKSESVKHIVRRILNKANTKNVSSRAREDGNLLPFFDFYNDGGIEEDDNNFLPFFDCDCECECECDGVPSASASPSTSPPTYIDKMFLASDGEPGDTLGDSCLMTDDLVSFGAYNADDDSGAAYLFSLDGTEVSKLEAEDNAELNDDNFGYVVSMDEKIVVGTFFSKYIRVFSRDGTHERTITCEDCTSFGTAVATLGNKIATMGGAKLFIYTTDGDLLKEEDYGEDLKDVTITVEYIVSATRTKTVVYSNVEPDFPLLREIEQGGEKVAIAGDKLVIGDSVANSLVGSAWLYNIDGTLIKELEHDINTVFSKFGSSIAITNDKIIIGAKQDDVGGDNTGSVFIYSAIDGAFEEKVLAPDAQEGDLFGSCVSATDSYYVVGSRGYDDGTGAGYLFNLPL